MLPCSQEHIKGEHMKYLLVPLAVFAIYGALLNLALADPHPHDDNGNSSGGGTTTGITTQVLNESRTLASILPDLPPSVFMGECGGPGTSLVGSGSNAVAGMSWAIMDNECRKIRLYLVMREVNPSVAARILYSSKFARRVMTKAELEAVGLNRRGRAK